MCLGCAARGGDGWIADFLCALLPGLVRAVRVDVASLDIPKLCGRKWIREIKR